MSLDISEQSVSSKYELEDQLILRLPQKEANELKKALRSKLKKVKKLLKISLNDDASAGTVYWNKKKFNAKLFDLPCHIESLKTLDGVDFYKTADISKIILCKNGNFESPEKTNKKIDSKNNHKVSSKKNIFPHGISPPLKNVKKKRFRKVLRNRNDFENSDEIEKELLWLLRVDVEAVSSRFEIYYEDNNNICKEENVCDENLLFGEVSDFDS